MIHSPTGNTVGLFFGDPPSVESSLAAMADILDTDCEEQSNHGCESVPATRALFQHMLSAGHEQALQSHVTLSGIVYKASGNWLRLMQIGEPLIAVNVYDTISSAVKHATIVAEPALGASDTSTHNQMDIPPFQSITSLKLWPSDLLVVSLATLNS